MKMSVCIFSINFTKTEILRSGQEKILSRFKKVLSQSFRSKDPLGTYADEKFFAILPNLSPSQAELLFNEFFNSIRSSKIFSEFPSLSVNVGISAFPGQGRYFDQLAEIASKAEDSLTKEGKSWGINLASAESEYSETTHTGNVLIVEGDSEMLNLLNYAYTAQGYTTTPIQSGLEAVEWIRSHIYQDPPSLIVLDGSELEDLKEPENLRQVKDIVGDSVPVIFLSSITQEENILQRLGEGANEYIIKPFSLSILMEKTQHLLR